MVGKMNRLSDIGPDIVSLVNFLDSYLTMVAFLRNADEAQLVKIKSLMKDLEKKFSSACKLCAIEVRLPTEFESNDAIEEFLSLFPYDLGSDISGQLFHKHGIEARQLFDFAMGICTLEQISHVDSIKSEDTEAVISNTRSQGQSLQFPDDLVERCLHAGRDGLRELQEFLQSDYGKQVSSRLSPDTTDVFLSYAQSDAHIARELRDELEAKGLHCFMAEKDIRIAPRWEEQIRSAIISSKYVLLLLTPRSIQRPWVLLETGAAWALQKNLIPLLVQVAPSDLIDPIRMYQAQVIETAAQRESFVSELVHDAK